MKRYLNVWLRWTMCMLLAACVSPARADDDVTAEPAGTWKANISMEGGVELEAIVKISRDEDGELSEAFELVDLGEGEVQEVKVEGDKMTLTLAVDFGGQDLSVELVGTITGDDYEGTVTYDVGGEGGELEFKAARQQPATLAGTWQLEIDATSVGGEIYEPTIDFTDGDDGTTGSLTFDADSDPVDVTEISLEGNEAHFESTLDFGGTELVIKYDGELEGDKIAGTLTFDLGGQEGELEFTGERQQNITVAGVWKVSIDATTLGGEVYEPVAEIRETEDGYTGELDLVDGVEGTIEDIQIEGNTLTFKATIDFGGADLVTHFNGKIDGDKIAGTVEFDLGGDEGELDFTGERSDFPADIVGTWNLSIDATSVGGEVYEPVAVIENDDDGLEGSVILDDGQETDIEDIKLDGNHLTFTVNFDFGGTEMKLLYDATVDGNSMAGTVEFDLGGQTGELEFSGERTVQIAGAWVLSIDATPVGGEVYEPTATLTADGEEWNGSFTTDDGQEVDITDIELDGDTLKFKVTLDFGGSELVSNYTLTVDGNELDGNLEFDVDGNVGELEVTGQLKDNDSDDADSDDANDDSDNDDDDN